MMSFYEPDSPLYTGGLFPLESAYIITKVKTQNPLKNTIHSPVSINTFTQML
jgi:hypothetical protein